MDMRIVAGIVATIILGIIAIGCVAICTVMSNTEKAEKYGFKRGQGR